VPDLESHHQIQSALQEAETHLAREPDNLQLHFERARLLARAGKLHEAKQAYIDILLKDTNHFAAYINLGVVLTDLGFYKAARKVYREVMRRFPNDPAGKINLAYTLHQLRAFKESRLLYEAALQMVPHDAKVHYGLSDVLMEMGEVEAAVEHRRRGFAHQPWIVSTYRGSQEPVRVLLLGSPLGGNAPIEKLLDPTVFLRCSTYADFYTKLLRLPPHHAVINLIGDADICGPSLDAAERLLKEITTPVLNPPARIRATGRADNAQALREIEGVVTPRTLHLSRDILLGAEGLSVLEKENFRFPLLLRTPGFHGGQHFVKVERAADLATAATGLPGQELTVIQFLQACDTDGKVRKYRVMMIDGQLYPLHKAVSRQWKVHYFSAHMAHSPEHRAEDAAFLEDMPGVLGPRAMQALKQISLALGLDYAGADFSLGPGGEVMLFEANATMNVPKPENGPEWDYRRAPVDRIYAAVRDMILQRIAASAALATATG